MAKKILVIDDEIDLLKMVVVRLKKLGYDVVQAVDGEKGLEMMRSQIPDLVLLDLRMPIIDGYQVCQSKKSDDTIKNIPVILFTASFSSKFISEKVQELGANDYITKPFDAKELLAKIKKILGE